MAGRGFAPQERNGRGKAPKLPMRELADTGEMHGPELPDGVLPGGEDWHPMTRALWDSLRRSPLLAEEPELGWVFLIDTALMHSVMWSKGKWEFASEVRLRLAKYGATPEDRLRLRLKITTPADQDKPTEATPAETAARRRSLRIADGA